MRTRSSVPDTTTRRTFVAVPRAQVARCCELPWAELVDMAALGTDGLRFLEVMGLRPYPPRDRQGQPLPGWEDWGELAILREAGSLAGDSPTWRRGWPLLYQQNF